MHATCVYVLLLLSGMHIQMVSPVTHRCTMHMKLFKVALHGRYVLALCRRAPQEHVGSTSSEQVVYR
jgi:hypothetical protein